MNVLVGRGHGTHAVLARAALLPEGGRATLEGDLLAEVARRLRRKDAPLDVVLVARDAAQALLLRLPGLSVVGVIAAEDAAYPLPEEVAVVAGVADALSDVPEGEWVIVDPARDRVVVAPDAHAIARVQNRPERPRVFLGAAHMPARTLGGVEVAVWAETTLAADVDATMASGADGVALTGDFPDTDTPDGQTRPLLRVVEAVGGGELGLCAAPGSLDPGVAVLVAAHCQAHWLLRPDDLPLPITEFRDALADLAREAQDADRPARVPRLVAVLSSSSDDPLPQALLAYDQILLDGRAATPDSEYLSAFAAVAALARDAGLPLRAWLSGDVERGVSEAVRLGVTGIIVPPGHVAAAKDAIRIQE